MAKKLPQKVGSFLMENKNEIIQLVQMKVELIKSILDYKKTKEEISLQKEALDVKRKEIEANTFIELQRIKASLESSKMEYEIELSKREMEHTEKMKKLDIVHEQLKEGNELIKMIIEDNKEEIIKYHKDIIKDFTEFQLNLVRVLKDL